MAFQLTDAQQLAVDNTGGPLLVSAAAGAGKTRVLVERLLDRVSKGADVDRFLIITFTNAAAAELRGRILEELSAALAGRPSDRHLRRQLTLVYQAQISTVHAFCGELLRQWGYLIDLERDYRLCDDSESDTLRLEALENVLDRRYQAPDAALDALLDTFEPGREDNALGAIVLQVHQKLQSYSDPTAWLEHQKVIFRTQDKTDAVQTPWGEYLLERYRALAAYWHDRLAPLAQACRSGVPGYAEGMEATVTSLAALAQAKTWEDAAFPDFRRLGSSAKCPDPDLAQRAKDMREACKKQFNKDAAILQRASRQHLDDLESVRPAVEALVELVEQFGEEYRALKTKRGVLDFSDLEHLALRLLTDYPQVARECSDRLEEVMVDEYQDTNQVQNALFDALTREKGNLFMVGDVKQSIYRFRMADPSIFLKKYNAWPNAPEAAPGQSRRVILGENFRSRPEVVDCVNFLFSNLMSRDLGELAYGPDEALKCGGTFDERADCAPELHLLENPKTEEDGDDAMTEPRFIAKRLRELLDGGFPVADKSGPRPVEPSDMAILLRSPNQVMGRYTRALDEQGIPWASEGGEDFFDAPETSVALSYLEIIDNPRQDVPLIAVLRSPLYGFSPDRLARLRQGKGKGAGSFYDALCAEDEPDSRAFLDQLQALRDVAQDMRSYELLWEVYCRTGLLSIYCAMPDHDSRRAHLLCLYQYARQFESSGHKGLFGFLNHLRRCREQGERLVAPGAAVGGVRILSIHRSKGLEFPVVVLGGLGKEFNHMDNREPMLFHREMGLGPQGIDPVRSIQYPTLARYAVAACQESEMYSEELRLLYVALTRAREKLIMVCTMRDVQKELGKLAPEAQLPVPAQLLSHLPTVGHWVLSAALCRPEARDALRGGAPLAHLPKADTFYGGGWEMSIHAAEDYRRPPRRHRQGAAAEGEAQAAGQLPDYLWHYPWQSACDQPSKLTATQLKGRALDAETAEDALPQARPILFDRPDFAAQKGLTAGERGTAHHVVMQYLDYAKSGSLEDLRGEIQRLIGRHIITPQQGRAVDPQVLLNFFRSPIGREALAAGEGLHREFKFSTLEPAERYFPELEPGETVLLQGVVDCWFDTPQGLVILDFKSDRVTAETVIERAESYRPQLEAYAQALSKLLERPVARKVLWFFTLSQAVEL